MSAPDAWDSYISISLASSSAVLSIVEENGNSILAFTREKLTTLTLVVFQTEMVETWDAVTFYSQLNQSWKEQLSTLCLFVFFRGNSAAMRSFQLQFIEES